jgi:hypothetical protein
MSDGLEFDKIIQENRGVIVIKTYVKKVTKKFIK